MSGVRILIQFTADSAATADAQVQELAERCRSTQQEPGCLQFEAFRSVVRPETWALVEHWASQEALDEHRKLMTPRPPVAGVTRTREIYTHQEA